MKIKTTSKILLLLFVLCQLTSCSKPEVKVNESLINTAHLDYLYDEVAVLGENVGVVHIYCEYPDYKFVDDSDEGMACIDDAARAAVFYIEYYKLNGDEESLYKAEMLTKFMLKMQAGSGWFYNFIFADGTINTDHINSVAEPGWWSWRAMWALNKSYSLFQNINPELAEKISSALHRSVDLFKNYIPTSSVTKEYLGVEVPDWLPAGSSGDQSALLIITLLDYSEQFKDESVVPFVKKLADGLLLMQKGDEENFPYYAILSWRNLWHGWGSIQSYALINAGLKLNVKDYISAGLKEIDHFYDYQLENNFIQEFKIERVENAYKLIDGKKFSQIAYQIRSMVYGCLAAYQIDKNEQYLQKAIKIADWLYGNNACKVNMYNKETGRCFDGIISETEVNKNSGAESTIEALLTLIELEKQNEK